MTIRIGFLEYPRKCVDGDTLSESHRTSTLNHEVYVKDYQEQST